MRLNPVFEKEMKRNSRSSRISWIIFVCNLLLAVVAFVCYFGESSQLGYLAPVSYSVPMNCYILMTYLLFILVVLSVPAVAGGSISLEREKKTLDVLLTTNLNPWRIITGKLEASLGVVLILTVSALPVLSLVVVFGGIGLGGLLLMAGGLLLTGIFVGSIGIFCSVVFKRTTLATVLSYVIVVFLVVGICACTGLAYYAGDDGSLSADRCRRCNLPSSFQSVYLVCGDHQPPAWEWKRDGTALLSAWKLRTESADPLSAGGECRSAASDISRSSCDGGKKAESIK